VSHFYSKIIKLRNTIKQQESIITKKLYRPLIWLCLIVIVVQYHSSCTQNNNSADVMNKPETEDYVYTILKAQANNWDKVKSPTPVQAHAQIQVYKPTIAYNNGRTKYPRKVKRSPKIQSTSCNLTLNEEAPLDLTKPSTPERARNSKTTVSLHGFPDDFFSLLLDDNIYTIPDIPTTLSNTTSNSSRKRTADPKQSFPNQDTWNTLANILENKPTPKPTNTTYSHSDWQALINGNQPTTKIKPKKNKKRARVTTQQKTNRKKKKPNLQKRLVCPECDKLTSNKDLTAHIKTKHPKFVTSTKNPNGTRKMYSFLCSSCNTIYKGSPSDWYNCKCWQNSKVTQ
jgi:hypothetical protein